MKRKNFIFSCALLFTGTVYAQKTPVKPIHDRLVAPSYVEMKGFAGDALDASYCHRILAQDVDRLIAPFSIRTETGMWQSEFWGKWITSAILAYRYKPEPQLKKILDHAVAGLMASQTSDGYIGNYAPDKHLEGWDVWGRKYCMLGLLSYYDLTHDKKVLKSASMLADHLIKELSDKKVKLVLKGAHRGMAATSVLEPVCLLYSRTGNKKYLDFAQEIVRQWETPDGPQLISKSTVDVSKRFPKTANWFSWEQGQKAYEMMSCYEGLLELYRLTGKEEYKKAVEQTWQNILENEINIVGSGAASECWFDGKELQTIPMEHYQETCVTATWIKMSQQLLRLTGEAKYADAIEKSWYNGLLGSMFDDGADWAKYSPLAGERLHGSEQCGMGLNCCVASGPRGLFTLPFSTVMSQTNGVSVNFFAEGTYLVQTPKGKEMKITQQTDYPASGNITLQVLLPKKESLKIRIRIPQWSHRTSLSINGEQYEQIKPGEYAEISREWSSGDEIRLSLDMRGRVVRMGLLPTYVAIVRGPIVLARDARLGLPPVDATIRPITDKEGYLDLKPVGVYQNGMRMVFKASFMPESHLETGGSPVEVTLCDYASAGNTIDARSWFRVWLPQLYDSKQ